MTDNRRPRIVIFAPPRCGLKQFLPAPKPLPDAGRFQREADTRQAPGELIVELAKQTPSSVFCPWWPKEWSDS